MSKTAVIYIRVSTDHQANDDAVSVDQQINVCRQLCIHRKFRIVGEYADKEKYEATMSPRKGKFVQPSGTRIDRPGFQEMLKHVATGEVDAIVVFDTTRLGRHLRVLGILADTLDNVKQIRTGHSEIEVWEADKNSTLTRLMLSIMITIAQEENERRIARTKMGRKGTLERGLWPSHNVAYGYRAIKAERGFRFEIDPVEFAAVKLIFDEAIENSIDKIRIKLQAHGYTQRNSRKHRSMDWPVGVIQKILTNEVYLGKATWTFDDGRQISITVP